MKEIITGLLLASISLFTVSCSQEDTHRVKVAINTGPDQVIWDEVIRLAKVYIFTMHCFIKQKITHHNMMCLQFKL